MKTRNFALCALGLAAAITFGGATEASAQSDRRIPVRKDQGTPAPTVTDTIRIVRVDTVMRPGRVDTVTVRVTRTDTVTQMQMLPVQKLPGLYFGVSGGVAIPYGSFRNSNKDGPIVSAQLGWFPKDAALGFRLNGDAAFFGARETDCPACPSPRHFSGSGDLLLRFPLDRTSKLNPVLYFFGGGGVDKFQNFLPFRNKGGKIVSAGNNTYLAYPGIGLTAATAGTKGLFYHWDAGAGFDFNVASAHMFVESKFIAVNTTNGPTRYIPITAGFKFY
jgi:hypothetical protein